ncbi:DUF6526 family protein [Ferruginibacter paludis]|uniref:DUF6526 family protein n=1 Tax=Ferruginibacter paludis TaxID=1310417 RepID=UPI0025B3D4B5|nr:DUF6526 family protein [Ferruginibacter paludis]MDN3655481.1 DUF6526 family protein [Ferruginibacter paludis]
MKQQYSNHKKYYIPHHFIFLPMMLAFIILGICQSFKDAVHQLEWTLFSILSFCIFYLAIMLRQHYALGNQNRIVRLEFRLRYLELFGERSKKVEDQLSFSQIAALRFAADDEFAVLLDRALKEKLSGDEIKKAVKNWQADNMRV